MKQTKLLVKYNYISGEDETCCEVLIQGKGSARNTIHKKFKRFWSDTDVEEKRRLYVNSKGYPAVKITGWDFVPDDDWNVLKKYLTEI